MTTVTSGLTENRHKMQDSDSGSDRAGNTNGLDYRESLCRTIHLGIRSNTLRSLSLLSTSMARRLSNKWQVKLIKRETRALQLRERDCGTQPNTTDATTHR